MFTGIIFLNVCQEQIKEGPLQVLKIFLKQSNRLIMIGKISNIFDETIKTDIFEF